MSIGDRPLTTIIGALFQPRHWYALGRMIGFYPNFPATLARYLLKTGSYPWSLSLRQNGQAFDVTLFNHHDLLTVNEVFCREDYPADDNVSTVVDFGSNIGITALYFLTRNASSRVYLFEPFPENVSKLKQNLRGFEDRYVLQECAVGIEDGEVEFGVEDTGRYGGIGVQTGRFIRVPCKSVETVFDDLRRDHGIAQVDIVKADIEGMEEAVVKRLATVGGVEIAAIYAEMDGRGTPLAGYDFKQRGTVGQWRRR